jgi:hypothetical protein
MFGAYCYVASSKKESWIQVELNIDVHKYILNIYRERLGNQSSTKPHSCIVTCNTYDAK